MEELGAALYNAEKETPGLITHEPSKEAIEKICTAIVSGSSFEF